jgi:Concanavalin A-like lectin/glucanases superfamily
MRTRVAASVIALCVSVAHADLTHHYTWDVDGTDASGNGNNGQFTGNATTGAGVIGAAALALSQGTTGTGYNGAFRLPVATSAPTPDMTVATWINVPRLPPGPGATGNSESFVLSWVTDAPGVPNLQLRINGGSGVWQMGLWNGSAYQGFNTGAYGNLINTGWLHVAAVLTASGPDKLYVDGGLVATSNNITNSMPGNVVSVYAGTLENGPGNFIGPLESGIDDLRIYNSILSDADIADLATAQRNLRWNVDADGTWNAGGNWTSGNAPTAPLDHAVLGDATTANRTITLTGPVAVQSLVMRRSTGTGSYTVNLGGAANLQADSLGVTNGQLTLTDTTAAAVKTKSVAISSTGTLRLDGAGLVVDYGSASPLADLVAKFQARRLTTSKQTLGIAEASALGVTAFGGWTGLSGAVLVRGTLFGDASLNGTVDFSDLLSLAQNYQATSGVGWAQGDFDYNGTVNFNDLLALAQNYGQSTFLGDATLLEIGGANFAADWALARTLVPEPGMAAAGLAGLFALLGKRRPRASR